MVVDQQILLDEEKLNVDLLHIAHFLQLRNKLTDLHILTSTENIIEVLNYIFIFYYLLRWRWGFQLNLNIQVGQNQIIPKFLRPDLGCNHLFFFFPFRITTSVSQNMQFPMPISNTLSITIKLKGANQILMRKHQLLL